MAFNSPLEQLVTSRQGIICRQSSELRAHLGDNARISLCGFLFGNLIPGTSYYGMTHRGYLLGAVAKLL